MKLLTLLLRRERCERQGGLGGVAHQHEWALAPLAAKILFLTLLLALLPLIGHGCHGDDVDHEPTGRPGERRDVSPPVLTETGGLTSRRSP